MGLWNCLWSLPAKPLTCAEARGSMQAKKESSGLCWLKYKQLLMSAACRLLFWGPRVYFRVSTKFLFEPTTFPAQQTVTPLRSKSLFCYAHPELNLGWPR